MKTIEIDGVSYVTARQLERDYRVSRRKCWEILSKASGTIRSHKLGNIHLYAVEDCLPLFHENN